MPRPSAPELAGIAPPGAGRVCHLTARALGLLGRLSTRRLGILAALLGVFVALPALWTGFAQDDHFFLMVFKGSPGFDAQHLSPLETFSFFKGDPANRQEMMERGFMPWWTVDGWKLNFWRPLASLSSWGDYLLVGERAWLMHLHSLVLYGILVFVATVLYRRFIPVSWAAGFAAVAFAVDSGHAIPVTWLAMRNAVLTLLFGLLLLVAHDAWRRNRAEGRPGLFPAGCALLCLALALLSGESAVASGGYLLAYALFLDPAHGSGTPNQSPVRPFLNSIAALLPYLALVIAWRVVYSSLGYGTVGSGLYIDPLADPIDFLGRLPARMAVLLLGLLAFPEAGLWELLPTPLNYIHLALAILFLSVFGCVLVPLLRKSPEARFMLLGTVLAVVPGCATLPMDRLMMYASFGALGLVALLLAHYDEGRRSGMLTGRVWKPLIALLIVAHLLIAPVGLATGTQNISMMNRVLNGSNPSIPLDLPASTRVVAVNTPNDLLGGSLPIYRSSRGEPVVPHWWWLYSGMADVVVERKDPQTLVLRPNGGYFTAPWTDIFRLPADAPIRPGDRFSLEGVEIEVLTASPQGAPLEVVFRFDAPLEDPSLRFVSWKNGAYVPFVPPAIGDSTVVPGTRLTNLISLLLGAK